MMHFPLCFRFTPIFEKFSKLSGKFFYFTFFREISRFSSAEISDDHFLVIDHKFRIPPLFSLFQYIPPVSPKLFFPPYFDKFPPCFTQIHLLFTYFTCIFPPTFTMMHLCITQCTYCTPLAYIELLTHALSGIIIIYTGKRAEIPDSPVKYQRL